MKKSLWKLNLSRETLRTLKSPALGSVGGGANALTVLPSCNTYCDITFGCPDITRTC
ncbi:MAG TPA: hypothetical protein VLB76_26030 [Thermoanaerobaculia bacterium]|jgi:hypothetical protein|nr:hypothetical protein [Thermoanaerobaculia bacterium]